LQTRRLTEYFEGLNSSLAQLTKELCCWYDNQKLLVLGQFPGTNISYSSSENVKQNLVMSIESTSFGHYQLYTQV